MNKLKIKTNRGMTYVELIVVLSIFAIISSVSIYNYQDFQANVDIKNLASDIASQIVTAQKDSLNGVLPSSTEASFCSKCKPSYGVYFDTANSKEFIYFADLDNVNGYNGGTEKEATIDIKKDNFISNIDKCDSDKCEAGSNPVNPLSVIFKRPDSSAIFFVNSSDPYDVSGSQYIKITIQSPRETISSFIRIYPSGRVQVR